jgi:N-glycosylase/DNA lyase
MPETGDAADGVEALARVVTELEADPRVRDAVEGRMREFQEANLADSARWFEELTYCLLTAYSSASMGQRCVDALCTGDTLTKGSLEEVSVCLRAQGHRFADRRAEYIFLARGHAPHLKQIIESQPDSKVAREWLVENVKGLGMKEASHYLRNVGYLDLAIIDRHILAHIREHGLADTDARKGITMRKYLEYERTLEKVAAKLGMPPGKMDLYLWYKKTGAVLK